MNMEIMHSKFPIIAVPGTAAATAVPEYAGILYDKAAVLGAPINATSCVME
jgi:siroheme synthase